MSFITDMRNVVKNMREQISVMSKTEGTVFNRGRNDEKGENVKPEITQFEKEE